MDVGEAEDPMSRFTVSGALWLFASLSCSDASPSPLPNIVLMMADDMGWGDWSRTGGPADTPHLDAMSRSPHGAWFERAYSGNPICAPTRASVMTGRTPARSCIYAVEQHILCRDGAHGCASGEIGIGNLTKQAKGDYLTGFYGKWHLGALSDRGVGSADCYAKPANTSCQLGYWEKDGGCCFGLDGPKLQVSHPLHFGFDEFVATPECSASATPNCGCFFYPTPHNDSKCELGHYAHGVAGWPGSAAERGYLECMQYYTGNVTESGHVASIEPHTSVSGVDDSDYLVDQFERLLVRATAAGRPFVAVIFYHAVHIPYVAAPYWRERYLSRGFDENEADYWGSVTQIDAAVGRVRSLLKRHGVADRTWLSLTADNGPEVDPESGQGTNPFRNPGRTAGLRGRKRDATEGGTRVIGLVEYPKVITSNRHEPHFPISTLDLAPTLIDILGLDESAWGGRPLDGTSLLPTLRGKQPTRPVGRGIGVHGSFPYGDTNHQCVDAACRQTHTPFRCPVDSASARLGDVPANFTSAAHGGWQFSWAEGNHLKLFGCNGYCNGNNCNNTRPGFRNPGWHFFLYNLTADRAEEHDLWEAMRPTATAMLGRFNAWQQSILRSQGPDEIGCYDSSMPAPQLAALPPGALEAGITSSSSSLRWAPPTPTPSLLQPGDLPYPRSATPASHVQVVSTTGLSHDDAVTLQTLAGVLARDQPQLYTIDSPSPTHPVEGDTTVFWLHEMVKHGMITVSYEHLSDFPALLGHFAPKISGFVTYDPSRGSTNAALIYCAAAPGRVIAVGSNVTAFVLTRLGVPLVADVSRSSPYEEFKRGEAALSTRIAAFQPDDGSKAHRLTDYAVFARAATVWAPASGISAEFDAVLSHLDKTRLNAAFGWGGDEHQWVARCSQSGAVAHASDFASNIALLANVPPSSPSLPPAPPPSPPPPATSPPVHTVAFITSDGDNIQLLQHADFMDDKHYSSPLRGSIPVGWSYSPAMAALMPSLLAAVRANLTANDSLSAGPSGAGYAYPSQFTSAQADAFGRVTAALMAEAGQSIVNVIGVSPSAESLLPLLRAATPSAKPAAIVYLTFGAARMGYAGLHGNVAYLDGTPVVGARLSLWGDATSGDKVGVDGLVNELQTLPKDPTNPNSYSIIVSELGNGYKPLVDAANQLQALGGFEVVLPEELISRMVSRTRGAAQCPLPSGSWSRTCGDLPRCSIAGNGSCVFTCESIKHGLLAPLPRRASCDLHECTNLTLGTVGGRLRFLCDGKRPCPEGGRK